ncbi:MAG: helix-hairpin-helix domain-containing protein [Chitinophagaceae bacterium]
MKRFVKDYFSFSIKDRNATILLILIMLAFIIIPYVYKARDKTIQIDSHTKATIEAMKQIQIVSPNQQSTNHSNNYSSYNKEETSTVFKPFYFDPNTVDANGWHQLGLRDKTIQTILNYRSKGGRFRQPDDIKKIWGLRTEEAERIIPYIRIEGNNNQVFANKNSWANNSSANKLIPIDINTATPDMLKPLPGISDGLHYKIVKFRDKLGGFISIDQVKETYGISDSAFQMLQPYLQIKTNDIVRLNINTASEFELSAHPYIERNVAKAIVLYRQQHGNYNSVNDLKKIVFIKDALLQKIGPYITVD